MLILPIGRTDAKARAARSSSVLIDTGPLVAAPRRRDAHHEWARAHFEAATEPFATCEAVISESLFLLERTQDGKEALWNASQPTRRKSLILVATLTGFEF
jgi:predicted nucleic acid-binding protein